MKIILCICFLIAYCYTLKLEIGPDNFIPEKNNIYLCGSILLDEHPRYYIKAFYPKVNPEHVHHFAIVGCKEPGINETMWNSKNGANLQSNLTVGPFCKEEKDHTLFDWSYNTSNLKLPENVSYEAGFDTSYRYIVYEIHYPETSMFQDGQGDSSKIIMEYSTVRTNYAAGFLGTAPSSDITFAPGEYKNLDMITQAPVDVHPMYYQVHTHGIGTKISGYIVDFNSSNPDATTWIKIGQRDPRLPGNFVPTMTNQTLTKDNIFAVRCHYYNFQNYTVKLGVRKIDEMCNMYIIFWSDWGSQIADMMATPLTNLSSWEEYGLKNIPPDA